MKIIVFIIFGIVLYFVSDFLLKSFHKRLYKKYKRFILPGVAIFTALLFFLGAYLSSIQPDIQCGKANIASQVPTNLQTAEDYFNLGNDQYDLGACAQAINSYGKAISLNPKYAQAYNNKAYTEMRVRDYKDALSDLDKAIEINPNYVQALMNRGDIYNYYYNIDRARAISDYNRVLSLVKDNEQRRSLAVCGHKLLAENGGWRPKVYLQVFLHGGLNSGCE